MLEDVVPLKSPLEELKETGKSLISSFSAGAISDIFPESYTEIIDHYFRRAHQESGTGDSLFREKSPFALIAMGGYGRKELCLHSDIDIMVLFNKKVPSRAKDLAKEILFPLWDLGFELGYGIRSIKDCIALAKNDFAMLTSMMDSRFLAGDFPLYISFAEDIRKKIIVKKTVALKDWLNDSDVRRMETFGDASYLLEPNLKEGIGGLRDYHHILWLAQAFFQLRSPEDLERKEKLTHNEYQELKKRLKFIRLVRNHLHQLSGRKNDRLGFEYQEKIARKLGFRDKDDLLAVEQFMGQLHSYMATVKSLHRSFERSNFPRKKDYRGNGGAQVPDNFSINNGEVNFSAEEDVSSDPYLLIDIFALSSKLGCPLSRESKKLVGECLYLVNDSFRKSERAGKIFRKIINEPQHTFETLDQMMEVGFLDRLIPEFGRIKDHVQFDTYHIYPVGRHSLQTVNYLKSLPSEQDLLLRNIFVELQCPGRLFLAGLFHDIGKFGKEHALKGSEIVREILRRLGCADEEIEEISLLIRHHLFLVEVATRRDLNDEKLVVQCARQIGAPEVLKMLYLLTWADSRATGPKAWNEWTANLVRELFFKILHILEKGELAAPDASRKAERVKSEVRRDITSDLDEGILNHYLEAMSPRYLLNTSSRDIVRHLGMIERHKQEEEDIESGNTRKAGPGSVVFATEKDTAGDCWEITVLSRDRPGLFFKIAGVLAINNINILSAEIYTWRDGTTVDIFRVTNPIDTILVNEIWKKAEQDLRNALTGRLSLEYRLARKAAPSILSDPTKPRRRPEVMVDNGGSDFFTIIEVFADDRVGLLFQVTRTLFDLHLDIRIAKISTKADQVADIFYVRDLEGQKVEDPEHIEEIKGALMYQLENW